MMSGGYDVFRRIVLFARVRLKDDDVRDLMNMCLTHVLLSELNRALS